MRARTAKFAAHDSLDVWQFIRLAPRSSLLRQTQPGATTHDRTPTAPRGVGEGEPGGSGDGLGGDVDGALARRAVLFEEVVVAPRGSSRALGLSGSRAAEPKWRREAAWAGVTLVEEIDCITRGWHLPTRRCCSPRVVRQVFKPQEVERARLGAPWSGPFPLAASLFSRNDEGRP